MAPVTFNKQPIVIFPFDGKSQRMPPLQKWLFTCHIFHSEWKYSQAVRFKNSQWSFPGYHICVFLHWPSQTGGSCCQETRPHEPAGFPLAPFPIFGYLVKNNHPSSPVCLAIPATQIITWVLNPLPGGHHKLFSTCPCSCTANWTQLSSTYFIYSRTVKLYDNVNQICME